MRNVSRFLGTKVARRSVKIARTIETVSSKQGRARSYVVRQKPVQPGSDGLTIHFSSILAASSASRIRKFNVCFVLFYAATGNTLQSFCVSLTLSAWGLRVRKPLDIHDDIGGSGLWKVLSVQKQYQIDQHAVCNRQEENLDAD